MNQVLSDAVRVNARISPEGASRREFGITLLLAYVGTQLSGREEINFARSVQRFENANAVNNADGVTDEVKAAAAIYFQQSPFPRNLIVGSMFGTSQPSRIFGATDRVLADIEILGNNVVFNLNDGLFAANFDGQTTLGGCAAALQTGIRGIGASVTDVNITGAGSGYTTNPPMVTFSAPHNSQGTTAEATATTNAGGEVTAITITNPGSGYTSAPTITFTPDSGDSGATAATATATIGDQIYESVTVEIGDDDDFIITGGVDFSFGSGFASSASADVLGLFGSSASVIENQEAETAAEALDRIWGEDCSFFWVTAERDVVTLSNNREVIDGIRDWVAAREYTVGAILDLYGEDVLIPNETTSIGAFLLSQAGNGIAAMWNGKQTDQIDHKSLSYAGRFSSVNFDSPNAVPNGKFLQLPGCIARDLTTSERNELRRKRINYYLPVGTSGDTEQGQTFATWIDIYYYIAWFKNALETAGYNYLKQSSPLGGVPITNAGLAGIADAIEDVCEQGVRNGFIAPNEVSAPFRAAIARATNNPDFDGTLSTGYIVVRPDVSNIDQSVRNARGPIPISVFVKGSGRVNSLEINVDVEN